MKTRFIITLASMAIHGGFACADVLYDATDIYDGGTYNRAGGVASYVSGAGFLGDIYDMQSADDFTITASYQITSVTGDFVAVAGFGLPPASGILVEFFEDLGGIPNELPAFAIQSMEFSAEPLHLVEHAAGYRIVVDLAAEGIILNAATWWVSITAIDESMSGDLFPLLFDDSGGRQTGHYIHSRDGGIDHGNGYPGLYGDDNWADFSIHTTFGNPLTGDVSIKIEGQRPCAADFNGDGTVDTLDFLAFLNAFNAGAVEADFNADGRVDTLDFLAFLNAFNTGCP